MSGKIPSDAFDFYVGLGPTRSYQAVADRYGVTKRAVVKHSSRERWTERLREVHEKARTESDKNLADEIVEVRDRHKKMLRAMATRALTGLKDYPLRSGIEAIRAAELVIKLERIIHGDSTERGEDSLEVITKREIHSMALGDEAPDEWEEGDEAQQA